MRILFLLLFSSSAFATEVSPTPFPVFLKEGFSSVLEFDSWPSQVVLGDTQSFQVEKLKNSIVIKPLVAYATTNMFVYFRKEKARLFVLTASEDANPTYYKSFKAPVVKKPTPKKKVYLRNIRSAAVKKIYFDKNKDFLTLDVAIRADSKAMIKPKWNLVRLVYKGKPITPHKLWSERKNVQKDSRVKSRYIFAKPNVPRNLKGVSLVIPVLGSTKAFTINLGRVKR